MPRVKHVLPMRDVFAHWIAQDQDSARMSNPTSWHFEGDKMYEGNTLKGRLFCGNKCTYVFGSFPWKVYSEIQKPKVIFISKYYSSVELESIGYLMWSKIRTTLDLIYYPPSWFDTEYFNREIKDMVSSIYRAIDIGKRAVDDGLAAWIGYETDDATTKMYQHALRECILNDKIDIRGVWRRIMSESECYRKVEARYIEEMTLSEYEKAWADALAPYREKGDVGGHEYYNVWSTML